MQNRNERLKVRIGMVLAFFVAANAFADKQRRVHVNYGNEGFPRDALLVEVGEVAVPANGASMVLEKRYEVRVNIAQPPLAPVWKTTAIQVSADDVAKMDALARQFPPGEGGENQWKAFRSSGGFSPAALDGPYLSIEGTDIKPGKINRVGLCAIFTDFDRAGGRSQADPVLDTAGKFTSKSYKKPFYPTEWKTEEGRQVAVIPGVQGRYTYPDPTTIGPKEQQFLLDFGKHPTLDRQLLYRVYVERFVGEDAVIIGPDQLQKLEKAKKGERVPIQYLTVPKAMLRVAGDPIEGVDRAKDKTGAAVLLQVGKDFVEDQGIAKEKGWGMDRFVKANRWASDRSIQVEATGDIGGTLRLVSAVVTQDRAALARRLASGAVPIVPPPEVKPPPKPRGGIIGGLCNLFRRLRGG